MANIMDYIDWRGDISFEYDPFNEVDNLVLAELAYRILKGLSEELTARKATLLPRYVTVIFQSIRKRKFERGRLSISSLLCS